MANKKKVITLQVIAAIYIIGSFIAYAINAYSGYLNWSE